MASSFTRNNGWVCLTSRSIMLTTAPATKAPRMVSRPVFSATTTNATRSSMAPRTRIWAVVSCRRTSTWEIFMRRPRPATDTATSTSRRTNTPRRMSFDPVPGGVPGEQQRQQQDGGEVTQRCADDDELTEGGRAEPTLLQHGDDQPEGGGDQRDADE